MATMALCGPLTCPVRQSAAGRRPGTVSPSPVLLFDRLVFFAAVQTTARGC